ncbi:hypothetical protein QVG61_09780 [Thiohalobacter sp. IOR34]|uniref:hypothetical protein n=1 Tax=Thiohalobacter sp. IOR34 TaxID=3057176 RepID=UPI0025B152F6|nr:hypothetical protein [Thiohalobacter sp. IOR34]WJW74789.1 hypothetical protein QVG61_09780 [Thiohalobacter sp. IOR34]
MLMRRLAAYVMGGYLSAVTVLALSSLLALLLQPLTSPLAYLGGGALALVTLRRGARPGLGVMGGGLLVLGLLGQILLGAALPLAFSGLLLWLPLWLAALVLRRSVSLPLAVLTILGLGLLLVAGSYALLGDPAVWWQAQLRPLVEALQRQGGPDLADRLPLLGRWMTALTAVALSVGVLGSLLLGRWWQALLYNPGGFGDEFRRLQLGPQLGAAGLLLLGLALLAPGTVGTMATDLALVAAVGFLLQGLAVVHALVRASGQGRGWLIALYALLLFAEPHAGGLLALLGMSDTWLRLRERFAAGS